MAGREFRHHLGLPRARSALPLSPPVPAYAELAATLWLPARRGLLPVRTAGKGRVT